MGQGSSRSIAGNELSAWKLARWIDEHLGLLRGLVELRELGKQADEAVEAVLTVRDVRRLWLSWQLWEALAAGDGLDIDALLVRNLPYSRLELARSALWGQSAATAAPRHNPSPTG